MKKGNEVWQRVKVNCFGAFREKYVFNRTCIYRVLCIEYTPDVLYSYNHLNRMKINIMRRISLTDFHTYVSLEMHNGSPSFFVLFSCSDGLYLTPFVLTCWKAMVFHNWKRSFPNTVLYCPSFSLFEVLYVCNEWKICQIFVIFPYIFVFSLIYFVTNKHSFCTVCHIRKGINHSFYHTQQHLKSSLHSHVCLNPVV